MHQRMHLNPYPPGLDTKKSLRKDSYRITKPRLVSVKDDSQELVECKETDKTPNTLHGHSDLPFLKTITDLKGSADPSEKTKLIEINSDAMGTPIDHVQLPASNIMSQQIS